MKSVKLLLVAAIGFATVLIPGCGGEKTPAKEESKAVNVEVKEVKASSFSDYISVVGVVKADKESKISSLEGGIVKRIVKDKGSFVKTGDTIIIMDNDILRASLDAAKAQYDIAKINFERQEQIRKDNVNSEIQFLQAKSNNDQARANYDLAKARYDKTFITAPFSGTVDDRYYSQGEFAGPGAPIINLIGSGNLKVEAGVPEKYTGKISKGSRVKISFHPIYDETIEGTITFIGAAVSLDNRTLKIEVPVTGTSLKLKPEMMADLKIAIGDHQSVVTINDEALIRVDDGYIVFVENGGNAHSRKVEVISRLKGKTAVKGDLKEGDNLIVLGAQNLIEGEKVKVVKN